MPSSLSTSSLYCISYVWSTFIFFLLLYVRRFSTSFFSFLFFLFTYIDKYNIESTSLPVLYIGPILTIISRIYSFIIIYVSRASGSISKGKLLKQRIYLSCLVRQECTIQQPATCQGRKYYKIRFFFISSRFFSRMDYSRYIKLKKINKGSSLKLSLQ